MVGRLARWVGGAGSLGSGPGNPNSGHPIAFYRQWLTQLVCPPSPPPRAGCRTVHAADAQLPRQRHHAPAGAAVGGAAGGEPAPRRPHQVPGQGLREWCLRAWVGWIGRCGQGGGPRVPAHVIKHGWEGGERRSLLATCLPAHPSAEAGWRGEVAGGGGVAGSTLPPPLPPPASVTCTGLCSHPCPPTP